MRAVLLGAPGAGKGTQAKSLSGMMDGTPHISTGDILRQAVTDETDLGRQVKPYMEAGKLAPDDLLIALVRERLARSDCSEGFLLDGFPRTIPQAEALDKMLEEIGRPLDLVVDIEVPFEVLIERLTGRRTCPDCGMVYHVVFNPPKVEGVCDVCGGSLYQRTDDTEETVRHRLEAYEIQTRPLIDYYARTGLLRRVDGGKPVEQVAADVKELFGAKV